MRKTLTFKREVRPTAYERLDPPGGQGSRPAPNLAAPIRHSLLASMRFAAEGFAHVVVTQRNFRIQLVAAVLAVGLGIYFRITGPEWAAVITSASLVLVLEMINTAFESVVDMVTQDYHPLAKIAKDIAAGAVLLASGAALLIGGLIFGPYVVRLFGH